MLLELVSLHFLKVLSYFLFLSSLLWKNEEVEGDFYFVPLINIFREKSYLSQYAEKTIEKRPQYRCHNYSL